MGALLRLLKPKLSQRVAPYLPDLAFPFALFPPLPPFPLFPPLPPFVLFPPLSPLPPLDPLPEAAMALEVRLVESNIVTAGGVTTANRPQAFRNSRLSSSLRDCSFRALSISAPSIWSVNNTATANVLGYSIHYTWFAFSAGRRVLLWRSRRLVATDYSEVLFWLENEAVGTYTATFRLSLCNNASPTIR